MNTLGTLQNYSSYTVSAYSVNRLSSVYSIKDEQEFFDVKNSAKNLSKNEINDEAIISDKAKSLLASEQMEIEKNSTNKSDSKTNENKSSLKEELTPEERQIISELKASDIEIKAHEQAHIAAAVGINTSAPSYQYQTGPDGKKYAVGGEINISFVQGKDPQENIEKAKIMKAAALAPAEPSSQDMAVARHADQIIMNEQQELAKQRQQEASESKNSED